MIKIILTSILFAIAFTPCKAQKQLIFKYKENAGNIDFNPEIDNPDFKVGNGKMLQYYNFSKGVMIKGENIFIDEYFNQKYDNSCVTNETGYITIRFIVNRKGETGRFRIQEMNMLYKPKKFDKSISNQILILTKQIAGWEVGEINGKKYDYCQYLTFKIENGLIKEILP